METYIDIAARLVPGNIVRVDCPNGDSYMGEVDAVQSGGRMLTIGPGYSCFIDDPEIGGYFNITDSYVQISVDVTTRVFPQ